MDYADIRRFAQKTGHEGKKSFRTRKEARQSAKSLRKRIGSKTKPYKCRFCPSWHIGHRKSTKYIDQLRKESDIIEDK